MIHDLIMNHLKEHIENEVMNNISFSDGSRAGAVVLGPPQGNPEPDEGRIVVTINENDPDQFTDNPLTSMSDGWEDDVQEEEVGATTWNRRFTILTRCLLDSTGEGIGDAREIASTVRTRLERALRSISYSGISSENEYVSMPLHSMRGEMFQAGGPGSYDFYIKIRFVIWTTENH